MATHAKITTEHLEPRAAAESVRSAARLRLLALASLLFLSGIAFCLLVVHQRDMRIRSAPEIWAEQIKDKLQSYYDERGFLPPTPPEVSAVVDGRRMVEYPSPADLLKLHRLGEPFIVTASPRAGLILPGADGCSAVLFENGKLQTTWMTIAAAQDAQRDRKDLLER